MSPWKQPTHYQRLQRKRRGATGEAGAHPSAVPARNKPGDPFYTGRRWRRFRAWFLARNPLCVDPFGHHRQDGVTVRSFHVDHIVPRRQRPDLSFDEANCQGLCASCHSRKTAQEKATGPEG